MFTGERSIVRGAMLAKSIVCGFKEIKAREHKERKRKRARFPCAFCCCPLLTVFIKERGLSRQGKTGIFTCLMK